MGLVRQLALPSAETVEKLSYGDPLFRMPQQSNIPITTDRGYVAEVLGMAPAVPPVARATTRISNEVADQLVKAITRNPDATAVRALEEIGRMSPVPQITTYHGSPYLFRQFDPLKVGTGEGAQAYGVGSGYTAEARKVAEGYREGVKDWGAVTNINERINELFRIMNDDSVYPGAYRKFKSEKGRQAAKEYDDLLEKRQNIVENPGYLYKGDIPDEILPKFLDWDKPLSEQSKEVKDALANLPHRGENWTFKDTIESLEAAPYLRDDATMNPTGADIYNMLGSSNMVGNRSQGQLEATKLLDSLGIRGIRYADEGSRGKYKAQTTYKGQPYSDVLTFYDKKQLDDFIKQKEDEGFGVKTFPQTSNFVPFNPKDFRIQEINDRPIEEYISQGLL
jgi:hypothetical protein